jgi:predicted O-methyltransferase YrrM
MNQIRITFKFILHFLTAKNTHGFGVHSPYVFHFTKFVLDNNGTYYIFTAIEKIRSKLKKDNRRLTVVDFGTGSKTDILVSEIATRSVKSNKYGQLLYRLSDYIHARNILELGTSVGLTTSYLAAPSSESRVISLEGSQQIADVAIENFKHLELKNIQIIIGNIDQTLTGVLDEFDHLDLIFIDANHTSQAVLNYFDQALTKINSGSIMVIDDIYWSADMEKAWKIIKDHPLVMATIDLFELGIVFFNSDLNKKHYKMRY